ncbi:MAG: hypothetical protein LBG11_00805 [Bifidobacteriaceae bacterium]|jgi:predicted small secreted protein|nr:hypothetical protein [Bifidobacteriaceae bacterium]
MKKTQGAIILALAAALSLAACGKGEDVATLGGKNKDSGASANEEQAKAADAMVECLNAAKIEAKTYTDKSLKGQKQLEIVTDEAYTMSFADGGGMASAGNAQLSDAEYEAAYAHLDELAAKYQPSEAEWASYEAAIEQAEKEGKDIDSVPAPESKSYLIIGEVDHSEAFSKCLKESGYTEPVYENDPDEEKKQKELVLEATTNWIKCARDNGFPDLADPAPAKADDWQTNPTAILPGTITEAELRTLLEQCPNFDRETNEAMFEEMIKLGPDASDEEMSKLYEKYADEATDPNIGFDLPGWNGEPYEGTPVTEEGEESADPEYEKGSALSEVLWESQAQFYEEMSERLREAGFQGY